MNKYFRYLISGYIFERAKIAKKLSEPNSFVPSNMEYKLPKVVVYTVSTGKYDNLREPKFINSDFDYYAFTSVDIPKDSVWKRIDVGGEVSTMTPLEQARYVKTHPHLYFKDYDISIFIDGNIQVLCDIRPLIFTMIERKKTIAIHRHTTRKCLYHEGRIVWAQGKAKLIGIIKQLYHYKKEGFPKNYGLFETNVIIRYHNDPLCINVMETWWNEIATFTKRDQLSFTYSLWKNNLTSDYIMSLGNCSRNSQYFSITNHKR